MQTYKYHFRASGKIDKEDMKGYTSAFNINLISGPDCLLSYALQPQQGSCDVINNAEIETDHIGNVTGINLYMYADNSEYWEQFKEDLKDCVKTCLQNAINDYGDIEEPINLEGTVQYQGKIGKIPETLYHITEQNNLESILKKGLIPQQGDNGYKSYEDYIYLTDRQDITAWLAILSTLDNPVILEVKTEGLENIKTGRHFSDRDFTMPNGYGEYCTENTIPTSNISEMELTEEYKKELITFVRHQLHRADEDKEKIEVARGIERLASMGVCRIHDLFNTIEETNENLPCNNGKNSNQKSWNSEEEGRGLTEALNQMSLKDFGINI